jgi:hypothetical protein
LRPGGKLLIETPNPGSLFVFTHSLYADPTHTQPVNRDYLAFVVEQAGFASVDLIERSPVPAGEAPVLDDTARAALPPRAAEVLDAMHRLLFGPQDYLLVATR